MKDQLAALIKAARAAAAKAYAPYSNHPVGAALLASDGKIYTGCNIENAAYPLGACAEAGAIGAMVAAGARQIDHIIIVGPGDTLCPPCGGCRQKIREFSPASNARITVCNKDGNILLDTTIDDLLPHSFGPANLGEAAR